MKVRIVKREKETRLTVLSSTALSLVLALITIAFIFFGYGVDPIEIYRKIFVGSFGSYYGFSETIVKAIPLILAGVGLSVAFKARLWNIGAEGQLLMGAIGATWIAVFHPEIPSILVLPTMFTVGFLLGAVWGLLTGFLKAKFGAEPAITTLMMNYVAQNLLAYLVFGPWKGPAEWGFPCTTKFSSSAQLPYFLDTRIHYPTLLIGLTLAVILYLAIKKTKFGYELRVIGENPEAAKYAGMSYFKIAVLAMSISGGLAGIAGVGEVAGIQHRLRIGISPGYGYTAIIVAWLSRLNPLLVVPVSLLFGGILVGGDAIQLAGLPFATVDLFNGLILLFLVAGEIFKDYKLEVD